MTSRLVEIITAADPAQRDRSVDAVCREASLAELLNEATALEVFRQTSENLYERVRALFFLYAIYRFHVPGKLGEAQHDKCGSGLIPFAGYHHYLQRRFEEAIEIFHEARQRQGLSDGLASGLATAYRELGFQTLANQVRRSVRSVRGNQWMFRIGHPLDQPLRLRRELLQAPFPILREQTPVRMDLSHSGWSDIFFLGMDFPEGARVLNTSVDLGIHGRDAQPRPPVEAYLRVIPEPVLRLRSVDLNAAADLTDLAEVFDFAKDYLGLLKAAVIAAGIVPPGVEGSEESLAELLARMIAPGHGLEIVSNVNDIPKGSRLAVSTNLLASLIAVCMRATGQAASLTGALSEPERRIVAARAILGEWLGGSGGGWQDSGGVWPGMKLITGVLAGADDPESGVSRGRLLPNHRILEEQDVPARVRRQLQESLILVHGGMAQNVGPILEMVTEKYLLRAEPEWQARQQALGILDEILAALRAGEVARIGALTTRNFTGPLHTIIPWVTNLYTETLIARARAELGQDFWGFWMLGGMSGGGMGFIVAPHRKTEAQATLQRIMSETKRRLQHALPFAMEPVVYDFAINERGTCAELLPGERGLEFRHAVAVARSGDAAAASLAELLERFGFDRELHERIRRDLQEGRIGLAQNRLPASTQIEDVRPGDVVDATCGLGDDLRDAGLHALREGRVAIVTLAAGVGSRWTQGAGVVKALHPFCQLGGKHRSFLDIHVAKVRRTARLAGTPLPHLVTTSYLTHRQIEEFGLPVTLSPGRAIGLRLVPMVRDLRFAWEEMPQQMLDEQKQKMRESLHAALIGWAENAGEGSDYTDNLPAQCLHPVGHWFEIPNLLRNGVLATLLAERPQLQTLLLHNIDTVGADVDPALLGQHLQGGACLTFEVITRRLEDRGGGLARVDGRVRLVEGLAMPSEEAEFGLSYYNSATVWIDIDKLLAVFGLTRGDLTNEPKVAAAIRTMSARLPTYITLKDVKKRWGQGQEDVFPVAQFEKLWGDMTALPDIDSRFVVVPRLRGQQLKDIAQLDGWLRDGSAAYLETLCEWA